MQVVFDTKYVRTYANLKNLRKAIDGYESYDYIITVTEDGRYYPIFIGQEAAQDGLHFKFAVFSN